MPLNESCCQSPPDVLFLSDFRNGSPIVSRRWSSFRVQSQSQQAQGSVPFASRQCLREWASITRNASIRGIRWGIWSWRQRERKNLAAEAEDPQVPRDADIVFGCGVLHHVADRQAWPKKTASEMKPGARFLLIAFKQGALAEGPPESANIPRAQVLQSVGQAGLRFQSGHPDLLPYEMFLEFRK